MRFSAQSFLVVLLALVAIAASSLFRGNSRAIAILVSAVMMAVALLEALTLRQYTGVSRTMRMLFRLSFVLVLAVGTISIIHHARAMI